MLFLLLLTLNVCFTKTFKNYIVDYFGSRVVQS